MGNGVGGWRAQSQAVCHNDLMLYILLSVALVAAPADLRAQVDRASVGRTPSTEHLVSKIQPHVKNLALARLIVDRAFAEARRRGLDPVGLLAVAGVESGYQSWRTHGKDGSHGIYQIIGSHPGPREARALLLGCRPTVKQLAAYGRLWRLRGQGEPCEAPEVAERRVRFGPWTRGELRDVTVSTYLAAYEVARHVAVCHRRRHKVHRHPHCRGIQWLTRWGHYNSGWHKPRWYYVSRLRKQYRALKKR